MQKKLPVLLLLLLALATTVSIAQDKKEILYVGTFSVRGSAGIYAFTFNRAKKTLTPLQTVPSLESPSYLGIHPSKKFLYSVNRGKASDSDLPGSVSGYGIDSKTGRLSGLNTRSSFGADPCYVSIDRAGEYAFISNYGEGNLVVLPLFEDGLIGAPSDSKKYSGSSVNPARQEAPHIHMARMSPDNKFLYAADLGTDKIYIYRFSNGKLMEATPPEAMVKPGTGPRHFAFHPTGNYLYLAEELTSTVAVFKVNKETGKLTVLQDSVVSLPPTFSGKNSSADIHVTPNGKFLYLSNRGFNGVSIFSVAADGKITLTGHHVTGGAIPRNIMIDPRGEYLFVAHQDSDTIAIFRINPKTGKLTPVGKPTKVPSPVCLKMIALP